MSKDYYKVLGIEKNASPDEIKRAFRKLAHEYHPDKATGNEAKFKEINEAYQVLGTEKKRQQYDQYGSTFDQMGGFGAGANWEDFMNQARGGQGGIKFDFGGMDLGDIFGDVFGFGGGGGRTKKHQGQDIQVDFKIEFKEAVFGVKKEIELYKQVKCGHCHGNLAEPGTKISTCSTCKGAGQVNRVQNTFFGAFQTAAVCPDCKGEGKKAEQACSKCRGLGVAKEKEKIEVQIPAGIEDGSTIRFTSKGEAGQYGGRAGDLYVQIKINSDERFERDDDDVYVREKISFAEAALGAKKDIVTLDGEINLKIPAGTQPGTKFRLREKGIPHLRSSDRGDMYVIIEVEVPTKLSRKQRQMLEDFDE